MRQKPGWCDEERAKILDQLADKISCSATPVQVFLE